MAGAQPLVFLSINKPLSLLGWPSRLVEIELPTNTLDHSQLIVAIEYLKLLG